MCYELDLAWKSPGNPDSGVPRTFLDLVPDGEVLLKTQNFLANSPTLGPTSHET